MVYICLLTPNPLLFVFFLAVVRAAPPDIVLCLVQDPEFSYEDFAPRGEQAPPTMRAQAWNISVFSLIRPQNTFINYFLTVFTVYCCWQLF